MTGAGAVVVAGCVIVGMAGCSGSRGARSGKPAATTAAATQPRELLQAINPRTVRGLVQRWKPWKVDDAATPVGVEVEVTPITPHIAALVRATHPPAPGAEPVVGKDYPEDGVCTKHLPFSESTYLLVFKRQGSRWRLLGSSSARLEVTVDRGRTRGALKWRDLNGDGHKELQLEVRVDNHVVKECGHPSEQVELKIFAVDPGGLRLLWQRSLTSRLEDCEAYETESYQLRRRGGAFEIVVSRQQGGDTGDHCEDREANLAVTRHTVHAWDRAAGAWKARRSYWDGYRVAAPLSDDDPTLTAARLARLRKELAGKATLKPGFPRVVPGKPKTLLLGVCPEQAAAAGVITAGGTFVLDRARDAHTKEVEDVELELELEVTKVQIESRTRPAFSCPRITVAEEAQ